MTESNTPVRGNSALSRDLWWCGNCGRGVGSSEKWAQEFDYLAGSWGFCPKCGQSLDWEKAGFAKNQVSIDTCE